MNKPQGTSTAPGAIELSAIIFADHNRLTIERALKSARGLADEIVVVDTRPRDGLIKAAASAYGATVVSGRASSSRATLFRSALEACQGDWVFWLDSDEWLTPSAASLIRNALPAPGIDAFSLWTRSVSAQPLANDGFMKRNCRLLRRSWAENLEDRTFLASVPPGVTGSVRMLDRAGVLHDGYQQAPDPSGEMARNIKRLRRALVSHPHDPDLLYELGLEFYGAGNFEDAQSCVSLAADYTELGSPSASAIYALLIVCLRELGAPEVGIEMAENARRLGMVTAELSFAEGWCCMAEGQLAQAAQAFALARDLAHEPPADAFGCEPAIASHRASMGLALALLEQGDLDRAAPSAEEALANAPDQPEPYVLLACIEHGRGHLQDALDLLQDALGLDPHHLDALTLMIPILTEAGEPARALQMTERLLKISPDSAEAHIRRGFLLVDLNRPEEALDEAVSAVALAAQDAAVQLDAGRLLAACADVRGALKCFESAISLSPAWPEPYFGAGDALYRAGAFEDAAHLYSLALELDPNNAAGYFAAGNACVKAGHLELAVRSWERALELEPDFPEAASNLRLAREALARAA